MKSGADPNIQSIQDGSKNIPLVIAVLKCNDEMVEALIKAGADVNIELNHYDNMGNTNYYYLNGVRLTLNAYNESGPAPSTLLYETIRMSENNKSGALRMLKLLLQTPDIDIKKVNNNHRRNTPLHAAVQTNDPDFVNALINHCNQNGELVLQANERTAKNSSHLGPLGYGRKYHREINPVIQVALNQGGATPPRPLASPL